MNINRKNLWVAYDDFCAALHACDFAAVDQEMTGVDLSTQAGAPWPFGQPQREVYKRKREPTIMFEAFQFGISLFTKTSSTDEPQADGAIGKYDVRPYNFFLLKKKGETMLSSSAVAFLINNGMDFSEWLATGINYCRRSEEDDFVKDTEAYMTVGLKHDCGLPAEDGPAASVRKIMERVREWYAAACAPPPEPDASAENSTTTLPSPDGNDDAAASTATTTTATTTAKTEGPPQTLQITTDDNGSLGRLLQHEILKHPDLHVKVTFKQTFLLDASLELSFSRVADEEEWKTMRDAEIEREEAYRRDALGFRLVWKEIVASRKPIIGHNFFQDLMFMVNMHEEPIAPEYDDFRSAVHRLFPVIYDTKTIATECTGSLAFSSTALGELYKECRKRAKLNDSRKFASHFHLPAGFYDYNDACLQKGGRAHEGAYDAYMTGICFIILSALAPDVTAANENMVSCFASSYFCGFGGKPDRLIKPLYRIDVKSACPYEVIERIIYHCQISDWAPQSPDEKRPDRNFFVTGMDGGDLAARTFTSFCLAYKATDEVEKLKEKLKTPEAFGKYAPLVRETTVVTLS